MLHDFCMTIPYGSIAAAGGLVSLLFGAQALGWQVAGAGAAVLLCSVMSLRAWRSGGAHLPYTLASAGARATRGRRVLAGQPHTTGRRWAIHTGRCPAS